ncbi:MAG: hypothetical protein M0018_08555 [Nitrospiraceae bacterium]|nr:hypothetical protein [Nitrospiraceae bacterium]
MDFLTITYLVLTYTALSVFTAGILWNLVVHRDKIAPAPAKPGRAIRLLYSFMIASMAFAMLRHARFVLNPIPACLAEFQSIGLYGECLLPFFAIAFLAAYARYEGPASDIIAEWVAAGLLFLTAASGWALKYLAGSAVSDVKNFLVGALAFHPAAIDPHPLFLLHYTLFLALAICVPFVRIPRAVSISCPIVLAGILIAARPDSQMRAVRTPDAAVPRYHYPADYWLRNHGRILAGTREFSIGECWLCHKAGASCKNCHKYIGVPTVRQVME